VTPSHFSYALLQLDPDDTPQRREWAETANGQAPILGDRLVGSLSNPSSVWTEPDSGEWEGSVVFNDNSAQFIRREDESTGRAVPVLLDTKFDAAAPNETDHLFKTEVDADAAWVYAEEDVNEWLD